MPGKSLDRVIAPPARSPTPRERCPPRREPSRPRQAMSCDWGFAADSMALAGKRERREGVGGPEPPPHPTFAPCLGSPERTSEGRIGGVKGRAGFWGVLLPGCVLLLGEGVEGGGPP